MPFPKPTQHNQKRVKSIHKNKPNPQKIFTKKGSNFKSTHKYKPNPQKIITKKVQRNSQKQSKPTKDIDKKIKTLEEKEQNLEGFRTIS
jgi:hypothetical protein